MDVAYINPFIKSACNVFSTMLDCPLKRQGLSLKGENNSASYEISGTIGISGSITGSVVFCLSKQVAFNAVEAMLGTPVDSISVEVIDAIGEITNMIAGGAKAELPDKGLALGLPNVVFGHNHTIFFPGNVQPICIDFGTPWGGMTIEVGFDMKSKITNNAHADALETAGAY